jgi:hypothetical protein
MSYIEGNFYPVKVWVRNEYLYQFKKGIGELTQGVVISVRCMPGQVALFQVLLDNGVLRDKLPSHALLWKDELPTNNDLPFHYLQIWNCFSNNFTIISLSYLYDTRVSVFMKDKKWYEGNYYATINWSENNQDCDLTLAQDPMEHKSHHVIFLDNGQIALQPNNRIKWSEPSFVTKPFPEKPDYLVNNVWFNSEGYEKWQTEDSQKYFYDSEITENYKQDLQDTKIPEKTSSSCKTTLVFDPLFNSLFIQVASYLNPYQLEDIKLVLEAIDQNFVETTDGKKKISKDWKDSYLIYKDMMNIVAEELFSDTDKTGFPKAQKFCNTYLNPTENEKDKVPENVKEIVKYFLQNRLEQIKI